MDYNFEDIQDDLQVDTQSYPEKESGPKPPPPGNYVAKAYGVKFRTKKDGTLLLWKQKYPVLGIMGIEITEPFEYGRKVTVFHDVPTMPFERNGKLASQIGDVLRAIDQDAVATGTNQVIQATTERLNAGMEFKIRVDYRAFDTAYAKAERAKLPQDLPKADYYKANDAIEKVAELRGWRRIAKSNTQQGKGELGYTKWLGPSGDIVDVEPYIQTFYPATENVTLGPDKGLVKA